MKKNNHYLKNKLAYADLHLPKKNNRFILVVIALLILANSFQCKQTVIKTIGSFSEKTIHNYQEHCAFCHGKNKLGKMGPALLPANLKRLKKKQAEGVILNGRIATQMPGFKDRLTKAEVQDLIKFIYSPLSEVPLWEKEQINKTHITHYKNGSLADKPIFKADMMNLFLVVELTDHHITLLDGDTFNPIHRFKTRFALHGGPKFTTNGRYVFLASRDGWVSKFDIYNLKTTHEVRAGINTRNLAVSGDGKYVLVGNYLPHNVIILSAKDLSIVKIIPTKSLRYDITSRVSAVYSAPPRKSFIVALKDLKQIWEISYDKPDFPINKILVDDYLDDFSFANNFNLVIGASRTALNGIVIDMNKGKKIAEVELPGMPHLGSGITWKYKNTTVMATPNLKTGEVSIIDMKTWKTIKKIKTLGPGFFMRSHEKTPYAWVDVFFGPNKNAMHVIDKKTLKIIKTLKPAPKNKTVGHVEFTKDGKYALVSIWDNDGAVIVYDAKTLKEVKRIPMKKPSGKYNVYNKVTRSTGTSK